MIRVVEVNLIKAHIGRNISMCGYPLTVEECKKNENYKTDDFDDYTAYMDDPFRIMRVVQDSTCIYWSKRKPASKFRTLELNLFSEYDRLFNNYHKKMLIAKEVNKKMNIKLDKIRDLLNVQYKLPVRNLTTYDKMENSLKWYKSHYGYINKINDNLFNRIDELGYDVINDGQRLEKKEESEVEKNERTEGI